MRSGFANGLLGHAPGEELDLDLHLPAEVFDLGTV